MVYIVRIKGNPPIHIVAGCLEPQMIISNHLWQAGIANTVEFAEQEPERSAEEKATAARIVNAIFKREHQS